MTYDNYICPCCGLPVHLEFDSQETYDIFKSKEVSAAEGIETTKKKFTNFSINQDNLDEIKGEIMCRLNLKGKKRFSDWFSTVICFVKGPQEQPQEQSAEQSANSGNSEPQEPTTPTVIRGTHNLYDYTWINSPNSLSYFGYVDSDESMSTGRFTLPSNIQNWGNYKVVYSDFSCENTSPNYTPNTIWNVVSPPLLEKFIFKGGYYGDNLNNITENNIIYNPLYSTTPAYNIDEMPPSNFPTLTLLNGEEVIQNSYFNGQSNQFYLETTSNKIAIVNFDFGYYAAEPGYLYQILEICEPTEQYQYGYMKVKVYFVNRNLQGKVDNSITNNIGLSEIVLRDKNTNEVVETNPTFILEIENLYQASWLFGIKEFYSIQGGAN